MPSLTFGVSLACTLLIASTSRIGCAFLLFTFPGTVAHELAHYWVALLLGAHPTLPTLWPRKQGNAWLLGSVTFVVGRFSAGLVALAPAYLLPMGAWASYTLSPSADGAESAVLGYIAGLLLWGAFPSGPDWRIALRHPLGPTILAALGYLGYSVCTS